MSPSRPSARGVLASALVAGVVASFGASCARARPSGSGGPAADPPSPVAAVGAERITKAELADFLFERDRDRWLDALDALVDERIVAVERRALGIVVPPAVLAAAVDAEVVARTQQLRERFGDGADLEASVRAYYGFDVATWRTRVLAPRLETQLALARVVRLAARLREQVLVRVIVVGDRAVADVLRGKLDRGADFSLTALEASQDPSRGTGGVIPPIARGDLAAPPVEAALFAAAPGALVGPLEVHVGAEVEWHLYRVVERIPAWSGAPATLQPALEADLGKNPVTRAEYARWSARVRQAYGVRTFAPDGTVLRDVPRGR